MPGRYPAEVRRQVVDLARSGTKVAQLAETFGMSEATIYNWTKQEKIDRGEVDGQSTEQALELAAAKRRIRQLETELAVSRTHRGGSMQFAGIHKRPPRFTGVENHCKWGPNARMGPMPQAIPAICDFWDARD